MITVDAPTLKRICANIDLFLDKKARRFGDRALVELSPSGLTLTACDDYAVGRDSVTTINGTHQPVRAELAGDAVVELGQLAGDQGSAVAQDQAKRGMVALAVRAGCLVAAAGGVEHAWSVETPAPERDDMWRDTVGCLADVEPGPMPHALALRLSRLHRMARVKGATPDDPMDVRILPRGVDIAIVKIGPTFRGALMALDREVLTRKYSESAASYLWPWTEGVR